MKKICQYISHFTDETTAEKVLAEIQAIVEVYPVDAHISQQASSLHIQDYESAIEAACAIHGNLSAIVTHRPQDFVGAKLHILSLDEVLKRHQLERNTVGLPSVNLSQWLQGYPAPSWQPAERLLKPQQINFNFRRSAHSSGLGKLLNLEFKRQVALVIRPIPIDELNVDIWVEIWIAGEEFYLPRDLEIAVLDQANEIVMLARSHGDEGNIRLNFSVEYGEQFSLRLISGSTIATETFIL